MLSTATRRRSSASEVTIAPTSANLEGKIPLFCPLPKRRFFHSRANKEHTHKNNRKEETKERCDERASVDNSNSSKRDLTRRKRNFSLKGQARGRAGSSRSIAVEPTNVAAYLAARFECEKPNVPTEVYNHGAALLHAGIMKSHMMDITLVGKDNVPVGAARFILACYSPVLEEVFFKGRECPHYDAVKSKFVVDFCNEEVIKAAVHHCFSGELPSEFSILTPSEDVARNLARLDHLAHVYKFSALGEVTYRALRKLINRRAVLACAIFDELSYREGAGAVDSIKQYALDSMREMPMDTLLGGGVQWMKEASVEAIMQDQDMNVDEFYMFKILNAWASANSAERLPVARRLSVHIELKFIETELLVTQVRRSEYFTEKQIGEVVKLIKDSMASLDPCDLPIWHMQDLS